MLSKIDAKKFNTLVEINGLINSNYGDLNTLLTHILDSAAMLCGAVTSCLLLLNREKQELYFLITLGEKGKELMRHTIKMGEGIAGWAALNNKSVIVSDAENDDRRLHAISKKINFPASTMMAVPMRVKDECLGVIELINKKNEKIFNQEDLEWLDLFANQAGIAVSISRNSGRSGESHYPGHPKTDQEYHTLIAKSPLILEKLEIIDRVAKTDSVVFILGESGVGKELFAEQIHLRSSRRNEPFVRVNCAAIPDGLMESELFGHVKGAFTNAITTRPGRFEQADGGTVFLDEIGDLSLPLQAKLLRVIQEKTFEKLGSDVTQTVDIRILAATNKDIEKQVEDGKFRNDLYYRLNVFPLYIPPLRQRHEDIPELADFFLRKFMKETKKHFDGFSEEAMENMLSFSWPGNVRELENCIERACVIGKNKQILTENLLLRNHLIYEDGKDRDLKNAVNAFKSRYIRTVLMENNWNQTETAKDLDIQRTYLSRLIKELNINNPKE
jgi:Nif-specific regulatory protein